MQPNSTIMKVVLSSAAEAELGALFHNGKEAAWLRTTLHDIKHPQPPTPIQTDNSCAAGIANDTVKQRRSKAIDMRFYWVRDRVRQKQFVVHWRPGTDNLADYFTKHHPAKHHRLMRSRYLLNLHRPSTVIPSGEGVLIPTIVAVGEPTPTVQLSTVGGVQRSLPTATITDPTDPHGSGRSEGSVLPKPLQLP